MRKLLLALLLALFLPLSAIPAELTPAQATSLQHIESALVVVQELSDRGIISADQRAKAESLYCEQATPLFGRMPTVAELTSLSAHADQHRGFGVFLNTVIVFAGIFLLIAIIGLTIYYLWDFLKSLPSRFYEGAAYVCTAALLASGLVRPFNIWFLTIEPIWFVIPGALAFAACVYFTYWLHWLRPNATKDKRVKSDHKFRLGPAQLHFPTVLAGLCTVVWTATAIFYHQLNPNAGAPHFIAFIATMALQSFFGFSIITMPHVVLVGWLENKRVPTSTMASFVLLLMYVVVRLSGSTMPEAARLFETGGLFMGAFVFYLGLLVMSNKWYHMQRKTSPGTKAVTFELDLSAYLILQAITILFGVMALYVGSTFQIGSLLGIGGTFFTLYLLEKYFEIPWKGVGWSWSLLGIAVFLYFFVGFAGQHPQYFIWGIR